MRNIGYPVLYTIPPTILVHINFRRHHLNTLERCEKANVLATVYLLKYIYLLKLHDMIFIMCTEMFHILRSILLLKWYINQIF